MAFDHAFPDSRELLQYGPAIIATAASFAFIAWCLL